MVKEKTFPTPNIHGDKMDGEFLAASGKHQFYGTFHITGWYFELKAGSHAFFDLGGLQILLFSI